MASSVILGLSFARYTAQHMLQLFDNRISFAIKRVTLRVIITLGSLRLGLLHLLAYSSVELESGVIAAGTRQQASKRKMTTALGLLGLF